MEEFEVPTELLGDEGLAVVGKPADADHVSLAEHAEVLLLGRGDGRRELVRSPRGVLRGRRLYLGHELTHVARRTRAPLAGGGGGEVVSLEAIGESGWWPYENEITWGY